MIEDLNEAISKVESLRDSNRLVESIDLLQQVLAQQPDWEHGEGWDDLGCMLSRVGKNLEAIECIERALTHQPGHPVFKIHLVDLLSKYGDAELAFKIFLEEVRLNQTIYSDPSYYGPRNEALLLMSQILARKLISAAEAKSRLVEVCPAATDLWNELA